MESEKFSPIRAWRMLLLMIILYGFHEGFFRSTAVLPERQIWSVDVALEELPSPPMLETPLTPLGPQSWMERVQEWMKACQPAKRELIRACDFRNIRDQVAPWIVPRNGGSFNLGQVCDIFDYIGRNWIYLDDPVGDDSVFPASATIQHFHGDCDDYTALLAAALLSIGGEVRVNYVCNSAGCHAYPEVKLGAIDEQEVITYLRIRYQLSRDKTIHCRIDDLGNYWLNLDWWAPYPGGPYFQHHYGQRFYLLQRYCEEL